MSRRPCASIHVSAGRTPPTLRLQPHLELCLVDWGGVGHCALPLGAIDRPASAIPGLAGRRLPSQIRVGQRPGIKNAIHTRLAGTAPGSGVVGEAEGLHQCHVGVELPHTHA